MAKNISIKQDGTAQTFNSVNKINTKVIGTGSTDWIPEDETSTKVKTITANGTYNASSDNVMGYSVVYVNVKPTQVTGVDTIDGKTYVVSVDENGYIVRTLVDEEETEGGD